MNSYMGHGPAIHTTDHNYSLSRLLGAITSRRPADAGYELEISQELQRSTHRRTTGVLIPWGALQTRALTTSTASDVVPTIHGDLVEPLRNASRVAELGATILSGLQGNVSLPRQTGASTAQWVAESGTVTASDATFDSVTLTPKTVGALSRISRRLLLQSVPGIEEIIRKDLMAVIGLSIDQAALTGTGLSNQPTGIITDSGVSVVAIGTNGGAPVWATVVAMVGAAAAENALAGNLGFLTNGNVQAKLMGTFTNSTYGEVPLWGANPDGTGTVAGYKALTSNQVPANLTKGTGTNLSALFFGNWADLVIGQWGALEVAIDESTYFSSGDIQLRVLADVDIAIRHPESFVVCKDVVTT
jgi:HK97 family phage major capsid protein